MPKYLPSLLSICSMIVMIIVAKFSKAINSDKFKTIHCVEFIKCTQPVILFKHRLGEGYIDNILEFKSENHYDFT